MPDYNKFKKIMAMMAEYEKDFEEYGSKSSEPKKSKDEKDIDDGGQSSLTDLNPEIDSPDVEEAEEGGSARKKAKIAFYGAKLKAKMGY